MSNKVYVLSAIIGAFSFGVAFLLMVISVLSGWYEVFIKYLF